jgi:hypothetical protein
VDGCSASLVYLWGLMYVGQVRSSSEEIVGAREEKWRGLFHPLRYGGRDCEVKKFSSVRASLIVWWIGNGFRDLGLLLLFCSFDPVVGCDVVFLPCGFSILLLVVILSLDTHLIHLSRGDRESELVSLSVGASLLSFTILSICFFYSFVHLSLSSSLRKPFHSHQNAALSLRSHLRVSLGSDRIGWSNP